MSTIRKKKFIIAMKFPSLKMQNFIAVKLNGFTVYVMVGICRMFILLFSYIDINKYKKVCVC